MPVTNIDFHVDSHLIQVGQGLIRIFLNGDTKKQPIEFDIIEIEQIIMLVNQSDFEGME